LNLSKKTIIQINVESNFGSTGKICENISNYLLKNDNKPVVVHGPIHRDSNARTIQVGKITEYYLHILNTRLFDKHGLGSKKATKKFITVLKDLNPDLIHLHNIHGYFINYEILFQYLKSTEIPVIWTLHDCWSFTGHCTHFEYVGCEKWKNQCYKCPLTHTYPKSWVFDRSFKNYTQKKEAFTSIENLTLVPVSNWLSLKLKDSFLKNYPVKTITNGIDINSFQPADVSDYLLEKGWADYSIILGVASVWDKTKGLEDFIQISQLLKEDEKIILVGLSKKQIKVLPENIIGIERTESKDEMINLYSLATVFMNLTYADTYPTTNLEALSCGTPIITYKTGGSIEEIREFNGMVIPIGKFKTAYSKFSEMKNNFKNNNTLKIRNDAVKRLDKTIQLKKYIELYHSCLNKR
tara:strand:+ start:1747 stop:2976 length:1230 start_codon:yes stop_codon:yes gene_type:complete